MEPESLTPFEVLVVQRERIHFPEGLPAFEAVKDFRIVANDEEAPFLWLQAVQEPGLAFVTVDPFLVHPDYLPDISDTDVHQLKIQHEDDAFLLCIVNIHSDLKEGITANLISPIVINWKEKLAKQVILQNHLHYSVKFRIDKPQQTL